MRVWSQVDVRVRRLGRSNVKSPRDSGRAIEGPERPARAAVRFAFLSLATGLALTAVSAGAAETDKSQYTLFNPTPPALMREFSTDRPDITESPFTVDAGHVQFESTLLGYTRSRPNANSVVTDSYEMGTTNMRTGLTNNAEVNFIWQPYGVVNTHGPDPFDATHRAGVGGLEVRGKINLWGNDSFEKPGATAFGLLPYISLPTDRGNGISPDAVEGGLILPFAIKLTEKLDLGLNAGVDIKRNDDGTGYHAEYLSTASFGYDWTDQFSTYYEIAARFNVQDPRGSDVVILATGFSYQFIKNWQVDFAMNFGVTPASDRINPIIGLSSRF